MRQEGGAPQLVERLTTWTSPGVINDTLTEYQNRHLSRNGSPFFLHLVMKTQRDRRQNDLIEAKRQLAAACGLEKSPVFVGISGSFLGATLLF